MSRYKLCTAVVCDGTTHPRVLPRSGLLCELEYATLDATISCSSRRRDCDVVFIERSLGNAHRKEVRAKFDWHPNSTKVWAQGHTIGVIPELSVSQTSDKRLVGVVSYSSVDGSWLVLKKYTA